MSSKYITNNREETFHLGSEIGKSAKPGDIFCLCGDLGAGKTVFAKGFASAFGIEHVSSPTFGILSEHEGQNGERLFHFDVYRIKHIGEMEDTGYEDAFYSGGICLIEWAEIIEQLIPENAVWISLEKNYNISEDYRLITISRGRKC